MKWPTLVPDQVCKTDIQVHIESEELNEEGLPLVVIEKDLKCNFQDSANRVLTAEQKIVTINGKALFNGDIAPELATISGGHVVVFDATRRIHRGTKARNPDGTVNYTLLELI